jgi:hypothetical protein
MAEVTLVAATVAALAVVVLVIRMLFLIRRVQRVWERLDRAIESDLSPAVRELGEVARGIRQAAGKLDGDLVSLGRTLDRVDRFTEKLEPELLAHLLTGPLARVASWVAGVRRGLRVHAHKDSRGRRRASRDEGESEPSD